MLKAKLIINSELIDSENKTNVLSVSNDSEMGSFVNASKEQVDKAFESARSSQKEWGNIEIYKKVDMFNKVADELLDRKEDIAKILSEEIAKPIKDSISEVERTALLIKTTAEYAKTLRSESIDGDSERGYRKNQKLGITKKIPVGIVLCISPFNYPINLSASKLAPALIGGNTVVFKSSSQGALSAFLLAEIFNKFLPKGVLNFVTGSGSEIGDYLITHKEVDMINFTGSTQVGEHIRQISRVPYLLELGGKDFGIVSNKANIDKAVSEIVKGAFSYSGQRCTAIKTVLVQEGIYDTFYSKLKESVMKLKVGFPNDDVNVSFLINQKAADYVNSLIDDAFSKGAIPSWERKHEGKMIYPLLLEVKDLNTRIMYEEQFGPVLPIYKFNTLEEAVEIANKSKFGLQGDIFTDDINEAFKVANSLNTGTVQINAKSDRGPDNFPFTGTKDSGIGTQGIKESILNMMKDKLIVVNL